MCGAPTLETMAEQLPEREQAGAYLTEWRRAAARVAFSAQDDERGLDLVAEAIDAGDVYALGALSREARERLGSDQLRRLLLDVESEYSDGMPLPLRGYLASVCAEAGDFQCAHFHGLRAAALGDPAALDVVRWLTEQHPDDAVREDLARWLEAL